MLSRASSVLSRISNGLSRAQQFLCLLFLSFFNPFTLLFFEFSLTFSFVVPFTLLIWFVTRWRDISKIDAKGESWQKIVGILLYAVNIFRNILFSAQRPVFGLSDMLLTFFSVCIAFYGFKGLKHFKLPFVYMVILIVGYRLESSLTQIVFLENSLANAISTTLNLGGIESTVQGNLVSFHGLEGKIHFLLIDAPCTGIKSMLAYGSLAILMAIDVEASFRKKVICVVAGAVGTFIVNFLRLLTIFLSFYFLGEEVAMAVHTYLGYSLFMIWIFIYWTVVFRYLSEQRME